MGQPSVPDLQTVKEGSMGITESTVRRQGRTGRGKLAFVLSLLALLAAGRLTTAASVKKINLVDMIQNADAIVAGRVVNVTDGFDANGVPYTEVTLKVAETIRGRQTGDSFSFRQFGLLEPRTLPSGKKLLATAPDGWSTFRTGEDVTLFLYAPARLTGLRTTVGLKQGKLAVVNGKVKRNEHNAALFEGLSFAPKLLSTNEKALVNKGKSKKDVEVDQFLKLVRRAVDEDWVGTGRMRHAN